MTHYDFDDYELADSILHCIGHSLVFRFIAFGLGPFHLHLGFSLALYPWGFM